MRIMLYQIIRVGSVMENDDDTIYRDLNRAQVNTLRPFLRKRCAALILLHYIWSWKILLIIHRKYIRSIFTSSCYSKTTPTYNSQRLFLFGMQRFCLSNNAM